MARRAKNHRPGRTQRHPSSVRLVLLTGVPGAGKTTLGEHLRTNHGFRHLDFEKGDTLSRYVGGGSAELRRRIDKLRREERDVVITWGFVPAHGLTYVLELRKMGFRWVWLDGHRDAARRAFVARGTVPEELLDLQLARIARMDMDALKPYTVNPFDDAGGFRALDEIAADVVP